MPTGRDLHHDKLLSNLAIMGFDSGAGGFIAPMIFPSIPVGNQSDRYAILSQQAFLRLHDTKRSPKTKAKRIEFDVSSDSYFADNYALATDNSLEDLANADQAFMLRESGTELVTTGLARDFEQRVANIVTSAGNLGSGVALSGSTKWSDYVGSDPVACVNTAQAFIRATTGLTGNTAIIDHDSLVVLRRHPVLLDMYKYTSGGEVTDAQIMNLFKVQRMLVGTAIKDNAKENGTASITNIWGNTCVIAHLNPPKGLKTVTLGLSYRWTPEGFNTPMQVGRQRFAGPGTENIEVIEAGYYQDEKVVARNLGYAITSTL